MMYKQTLQGVTYPEYPIQCLSCSSTGMEEIDEDMSIRIWEKGLKKPSYHSLTSLLKIDWSFVRPDIFFGNFKNIIQPIFEIENETALIAPEKKDISARILEVTNKLIEEEETFKVLDKKKIENFLQSIERNIPLEQLEILSDEELLTRIKKALGIELMCGLLNDLSEKQIMTFESTIKRRDLFK